MIGREGGTIVGFLDVLKGVKAIQEGKFQEACDLYERITRELEAKYKSEESNQS